MQRSSLQLSQSLQFLSWFLPLYQSIRWAARRIFWDINPISYYPISMQDTFAVGDLTVSKKVDPQTLQPGDIVTFESIDPANYGEIVTHKIREITTYEGKQAFVTYGTTTGVDDAYPALFENVVGEYVFKLPKMGYFFNFLKSHRVISL